jgi:hypothetical protein
VYVVAKDDNLDQLYEDCQTPDTEEDHRPRATGYNQRLVKKDDLLDFQVGAAISLGVATGSPPDLYLLCCLPSVRLSDELAWLIDYLEFRSWGLVE